MTSEAYPCRRHHVEPCRATVVAVRRVILESPYAANDKHTIEEHIAYARRALLDSLRRNEAPLASHLIYTQALDDGVPAERALGLSAGHAWIAVAEAMVCYVDLGVSRGMQAAIDAATAVGLPVEHRRIGA